MAIQKPSHTFTKIHLKALHTKSLHILFLLSFTVFINTFSFAQELPKKNGAIPAEQRKDSTTIVVDTIIKPPRFVNIKFSDNGNSIDMVSISIIT